MTQYLSEQTCSKALAAAMVALWKSMEKYVEINADCINNNVMAKLSSTMETYCLLDLENKACSESLSEAREVDITSMTFKEVYEKIMEEKKKALPDPKHHPKYKLYEERVAVLLTKKELEPPQGDEELVITQADVNTIDPISKQQMVSPVKNMKCGHSYDKQSITALFRNNKKQRCPYVGCPNRDFFTHSDLEEDYELKQIIQRGHSKSQVTNQAHIPIRHSE